ncbi:MAG: helix-turn-helix domain-containing protein [Patescibacteria group bacterium]
MDQERALQIMKTGRNVYLTGVAGSGKTYVLNQYIRYLKEHNMEVAVTASTGIAATHLGGVTIHSWSGLGIREFLTDMEIDELEQKEYLYKRIIKTNVLIIDEVSMLKPGFFDSLERLCRAIRKEESPFGGIQLVLSGDFFQLPPINREGEDIEFIDRSHAWHSMDLRVCYLQEQFRHQDKILEGILNEMRSGWVSEPSKKRIYGLAEQNREYDITPTRLYTHNANVDRINEMEMDKLPGREEWFVMNSKGKKAMVDKLKKSTLALEELRLKKDAIVMFVKNNFEEGYVNGTLGMVKGFQDGLPAVETFAGSRVLVEPAQWSFEEDGKTLAMIEQIPLRPAWAITIHKSQGMSLDAAEIDLSSSFVAGQGYVALSRVRTLAGIFLKGINETAFAVHPYVLDLDRWLLRESKKWEEVTERFSEEDFQKLHNDFIIRCGGDLEAKQLEEPEKIKEKVSTFEKTRRMVEEGFSLEEIAKQRGVQKRTILSHLEKLKENEVEADWNRFAPAKEDFEIIKQTFDNFPDQKLKPVYKELGEKYSYETIQLVRLFL